MRPPGLIFDVYVTLSCRHNTFRTLHATCFTVLHTRALPDACRVAGVPVLPLPP